MGGRGNLSSPRKRLLEQRIDTYKGKIRNAEHELAELESDYRRKVEELNRRDARRREQLRHMDARKRK